MDEAFRGPLNQQIGIDFDDLLPLPSRRALAFNFGVLLLFFSLARLAAGRHSFFELLRLRLAELELGDPVVLALLLLLLLLDVPHFLVHHADLVLYLIEVPATYSVRELHLRLLVDLSAD